MKNFLKPQMPKLFEFTQIVLWGVVAFLFFYCLFPEKILVGIGVLMIYAGVMLLLVEKEEDVIRWNMRFFDDIGEIFFSIMPFGARDLSQLFLLVAVGSLIYGLYGSIPHLVTGMGELVAWFAFSKWKLPHLQKEADMISFLIYKERKRDEKEIQGKDTVGS